ncbi:unnamed protein product [Boreogadus saida]
MEDMVIVSVCARPILYDTTMESYRDRNKKELAWVDVAEETGLPDQPSVSDSDDGSAAGRPTPAPDTVPAADPVPPADPVPAAAPRPPGGSKRKRATRVPCGQDPIQEAILQALHNEAAQTAQTPPPPQLSEDAFFVQSILPSLERLPRQACAELKFEIHKLVLEATRLNWNPNN